MKLCERRNTLAQHNQPPPNAALACPARRCPQEQGNIRPDGKRSWHGREALRSANRLAVAGPRLGGARIFCASVLCYKLCQICTPSILRFDLVLRRVLLGLNRDLHGKSTGVRTLGLLCLGSALAVLSIHVLSGSDESRVIQGIVTGVGFLGAGVIVRSEKGRHVQGHVLVFIILGLGGRFEKAVDRRALA